MTTEEIIMSTAETVGTLIGLSLRPGYLLACSTLRGVGYGIATAKIAKRYVGVCAAEKAIYG